MTAIFVALAVLQTANNDFFPTTPGYTRVFEDSAFPKAKMEARVGMPVPVGDGVAIPIETLRDKYPTDTVYYKVTDDSVSIVAYDPSKPLPEPRMVFQIGKPVHFTGEVSFIGRPMQLSVTGESHLGGKRRVLGKDVDVLLVTLNAVVGKTMEDGFQSTQEMVFGKGIGLIEMTETVHAVGTVQTHTQKIKSFRGGSPDS